ncbi:MAG: bifunctional DNA-binding transcriptional regulator/O6-methylguanine-DNA methyltransferase Ada, partial [Gemmatimonadales bacterium]
DGRFVYAVRTTRVYCRPSCASRRPSRANVLFLSGPDAAEGAGYRPCRRCRPRDASPQEIDARLVGQACRFVDEHREGPLRLAALAEAVGLTPRRLRRIFKQVTGVTPREYAEARRLGRLKGDLRRGVSVSRATFEAGYGSSSRVYEKSNLRLGMTPAAYRRGGKGMEIGYTIVDSPLDRMLVASTARGICSVGFGSSDEPLETALRREYPEALIRRGGREFGAAVSAILGHLAGDWPHLDLPLDVRATTFQWRVWRALQAIPIGETRSYGQIAKALQLPGATRAVARACATNPVALVVPCHRVIRTDGGLGGYRWGLARKQRLLVREAELSAAPLAGSAARRK